MSQRTQTIDTTATQLLLSRREFCERPGAPSRATVAADEVWARLFVADYRRIVQSFAAMTGRRVQACPLTPYMVWVLERIHAIRSDAQLGSKPGHRQILRALIKARAAELSESVYLRNTRS